MRIKKTENGNKKQVPFRHLFNMHISYLSGCCFLDQTDDGLDRTLL